MIWFFNIWNNGGLITAVYAQDWRRSPLTSTTSNYWRTLPYTEKTSDAWRSSPLSAKQWEAKLRWNKNRWQNSSMNWRSRPDIKRTLDSSNWKNRWDKKKWRNNPLNWRNSELRYKNTIKNTRVLLFPGRLRYGYHLILILNRTKRQFLKKKRVFKTPD